MSKKFKQLLVPEGYRHYWSKYPEGYTILEALLNWVDSVNQLTENVNDWNIYLDDFVESFDEKLIPTVREILNEMETDGQLAEIINEEIFSHKADKTYVDDELVKKSDVTYVNTELGKKADKTNVADLNTQVTQINQQLTNLSNNKMDKTEGATKTELNDGISNNRAYLESQLSQIGTMEPKGAYDTLQSLQTAYPNGTDGVFIVQADGHWYYWNGNAWSDGGLYQATPWDEFMIANNEEWVI